LCAVRLSRREVPAEAAAVVAASGSFAAISALLGSPILGAFLLMEATGLGGATLGLVLLPGLLSAGIGTLVFVGLDALTGYGPVSLGLPGLPPFDHPDVAQFGYALLIGLLAAPLGMGIRWLALRVRPWVVRRRLVVSPVIGLAVAGLAILYAATTGQDATEVLFSGQSAMGPLLQNSAGYSVAALLLFSDGLAVTPLVIVAVVVAHVTAARLSPSFDLPREQAAEPSTASAPQVADNPAGGPGPG
jgi:chloride channel protein, CIC family